MEPTEEQKALITFCETIESTGGVIQVDYEHNDNRDYFPFTRDAWSDLGHSYVQACKVLGREPLVKGKMEGKAMNDLVELLYDLQEKYGEDVQFAVDDLCYDYLGIGKHISNINNQGFSGQLEALAERIGEQEVRGLVAELEQEFRKGGEAHD